jgi:uncharacterized protein with PQ loop repeat
VSTSTIVITLAIVLVVRGIPQVFRTFKDQMKIDANVYFVVTCASIAAFIFLTRVL